MIRVTYDENGRASTEVVTPPVDEPGASPASPSVEYNAVTLDALRFSESYVVAEIAGDIGGMTTPPVRYKGAWHLHLAGWHV